MVYSVHGFNQKKAKRNVKPFQLQGKFETRNKLTRCNQRSVPVRLARICDDRHDMFKHIILLIRFALSNILWILACPMRPEHDSYYLGYGIVAPCALQVDFGRPGSEYAISGEVLRA